MLLNLNAVMSIIANVPAAIASTVSLHRIYALSGDLMDFPRLLPAALCVGSRTTRLREQRSSSECHRRSPMSGLTFVAPYSSTSASTLAFTRSRRSRLGPSVSVSEKKLGGVHVQVSRLCSIWFRPVTHGSCHASIDGNVCFRRRRCAHGQGIQPLRRVEQDANADGQWRHSGA